MNAFNRVATRLKTHIWIVLALPILLGIAGWVVPIGKMPSNYTAQATIQLGSYGNAEYNTPEQVIILLSNAPFYQKSLPDLWQENKQNLTSQLNISSLPNHLIQISSSGKTADETARRVNLIANAFLTNDRKQFNQKSKMIDQAIGDLKKVKTSQSDAVDRVRLLYKLESEKFKLQPAQLLEAAVPGTGSRTVPFSSKKRAILGFMVGITIILVAASLPEFVRNKEEA
ncbi:hypothetical protein [Sporolactobacillus laevolacticus]|uniref:hypothetical protein n=1 Tax=Sporolactobacillus laevolacticus TaxID=33018 RepID=UPI0025B45AAB|nr:hypothetical protein [Sporolactobacillus laevolacticus]MDN3954943.1 hypothetical protein [Sporolactobacillus laevolacticus]